MFDKIERQQSKVAISLAMIASLMLTSCASRPLELPPLPSADLVTAHVGVTVLGDREFEVAGLHGRNISDDVGALALEFASNTFVQASEITEASPLPGYIDLVLVVTAGATQDTMRPMGWSADTTEIGLVWRLLERDDTEVWSGAFIGKATNRSGPNWNASEKANERIKIALRHILADSISEIQEANTRSRVLAAVARSDELRRHEADEKIEIARQEAELATREASRISAALAKPEIAFIPWLQIESVKGSRSVEGYPIELIIAEFSKRPRAIQESLMVGPSRFYALDTIVDLPEGTQFAGITCAVASRAIIKELGLSIIEGGCE